MTGGLSIEGLSEGNFGDFIFLVEKLAEYEKLDPPDAAARGRLLADGTGDRPLFHAFVGRVDGKAVGYSIHFANYSSFKARPVMFLEDIFILEEHRRRGYGQAMFDHAVREAAEGGYARVEWCVLDWNEPAQRFYEKNGARRMGWYFYRLPPEEMARRARGAPTDAEGTGGGSP